MAHAPVITEEDFERAGPDWKGYFSTAYYGIVTEESAAEGDYAERGTEWENTHYDYLDELLESAAYDATWLEWSSSHPDSHDWITSESVQDYETGEWKNLELFIRRADKVPLSRAELKYINDKLVLYKGQGLDDGLAGMVR